jgi:hypothetical protein
VSAIVRASFSPWPCSAPAATASVPIARMRPTITNHLVSARVRIGSFGLRGARFISPSLGVP